jgi:SNF2 family DNA or RNA helicase
VIESTKAPVGEGHDVLLLQLQSGGVGLNLQHFSKIIFMSPWWTAALMDQAIGRAVRIGQREEVEVTMLLLKEESSLNIDSAMIEKAETKRDLLTNIFRHANKGIVPEEDIEDEKIEVIEDVEVEEIEDEEDPSVTV